MASNTAPDDNEVAHDYGLVRVYKSGRVERPLVAPPAAAGLDPATGVESKDVQLGDYSARLYLPPAADKLPVIVYVHGGGFVAESVASPNGHRFLNSLTAACPALAVSVEYRLAPEHPLPAAYEDCVAALGWVLSAADPWVAAHGDLGRVFVAGDSAGANACHHLVVQPDAVRVKGAVLIHPWFWGSEATLACERVMVCVAEGDFLRWRGRAYAEAVTAARGGDGQAVQLLETEGEGHVFHLFKPECDKAKEMFDRIVAFVNAP